MQLKVKLPSGEVNVPVEANSTPGHLKENLKYSLRVPPKLIKLTVDGRELDDMKPISGEPNNVPDGAILVAEPRDGEVPEEEKKEIKTKQPMMIKKEEPPKPKKPKKDVVRPTVGESDIVKKRVIKNGATGWAPKYLEGKQEKRHLAFLKLEAIISQTAPTALAVGVKALVQGLKAKPELNGLEGTLMKFDEAKGRWQTKLASGQVLEVKPDNLALGTEGETKAYPEQDDGHLVLALGDPHTSPAWTAAATQMDIGEVAEFAMNRKVVDFDPEGLNPTDSCALWRVELVDVVEAFDVTGDFSQLLHIETHGAKERAEDLDMVGVHWRVRRWMAEGFPCIGSSRERIAIMPGYGLVPIEDQSAPPVHVSVGEGQQEAVEIIASRVGPGGVGHLYLKTTALKENRPQGCVVMDVELVALDPNRGPGSAGWRGWQSLVQERERGDQWLEEADGRRKQLETFSMLSKSTGQTKDAEVHVAEQMRKYAHNAVRRYTRTVRWIEADDKGDAKLKLEKCTVQMRLAKASALAHQRFGEAAEAEASAEEKEALTGALKLLAEVLATGEETTNESLTYECLKMTLQVHIQAQEVEPARALLERLQGLRPEDEELKSDSARINRLEGALNLKKGAGAIEDVQKELQAAVTAVDKEKVSELVTQIGGMIAGGQVTWDTVRTLKVGKDIGNAMKMGDPDIAAKARKVVQDIQGLAQRAGIGL